MVTFDNQRIGLFHAATTISSSSGVGARYLSRPQRHAALSASAAPFGGSRPPEASRAGRLPAGGRAGACGPAHHAAHRHRDGTEGAGRRAPPSRERVCCAGRTHRGRRRDRDQRRGARVAQHRVRRVEGAQGQQRVHSRHRLEPGQPRRDDLYRRRPAAPRELGQHRAPRHRPGGVRPRPAERAVRPQHARRARQHLERPPLAQRLDGPDRGAARQQRRTRPAGHGLGPAVVPPRHRGRHRPPRARRVHDERSDRSRARFAQGHLRPRPVALDAHRQLGDAPRSSRANAPATATTP